MADFITGLNRLFRDENIIAHDDDDITTFGDTQHAADINRGKAAIQNELSEIVSERLIPYEKTSATITLLTNTRVYALESDFVRFFGIASFYDSTDNIRIFEHPGGEALLQQQDFQYKTVQSSPNSWYWDNTTTKKVGFYSVPNSTYNNRSLDYDYEKSVMVTNTIDTLPFHNDEEYFAFISMAARRFHFKLPGIEGNHLEDPEYLNAKSRLYQFLRPANPSKSYGYTYL